MQFLGEIDWGSIEVFFGEHGKLVALVGGFIGLMVVLIKYLHARISEKERTEARRDLRRLEAALDSERRRVQQQMQELSAKEAELDNKNAELTATAGTLAEREQKLNVVRTAFSGKEYDLWCVHANRQPNDYYHKLWVHRHARQHRAKSCQAGRARPQ